MPTANVETLRRYHELLNETGEPLLDLVHPDVEIHMFRGAPITGPYRGHDGVLGLPANFPLAVVVWFRDGLIFRFQGYREREEALEAAGLS